MEPQRELHLFRFLAELEGRLDSTRDVRDALRVAVRLTRRFFDAHASCAAFLTPERDAVRLEAPHPKDSTWDQQMITDFMLKRRPRVPGSVLLAPVERRGRTWAAIALERSEPEFGADAVVEAKRISQTISKLVQRIDKERVADIRLRIDQKLMEQLRPEDLFYQILHSSRALTRYDHSAALLIYEPAQSALRLAAEQIRWRKGKSERIGLALDLGEREQAALASDSVLGFDREGDRWRPWDGRSDPCLAELFDYNRAAGGADEAFEGAVMCAPLRTRDELLGVLKVASRGPGTLGEYETRLVQRLLPHAVVAIQNLQRAERARRRVERLEREMRDARSFQESLLPRESGTVGAVEIAARWKPSAVLGGDMFDYAPCGDDGASLLIADVSGHGASAAMLTALVKSSFHDAREEGHDPAAVARRVSRSIRSFALNRFVSLICVQLFPREGKLRYVNAGHPHGLIRRAAGEPGRLAPTGTFISPALPGLEPQIEELPFDPGDQLLLYTDGITEAESHTEGFFEEHRLLKVLGGTDAHGEALLEKILAAVRGHAAGLPATDDLTLLTARWGQDTD